MTELVTPETAIWKLGSSVEGRALDALAIVGPGAVEVLPKEPGMAARAWVLVLGGVHGDEPEGVWVATAARTLWSRSYSWKHSGAVVWAQVNPDGVRLNQRWNANQVDLNRNLSTVDWTPEAKNPRYPPGPSAGSEPENKALMRLVDACMPGAIVSIHSFSKPQVNANGPARAWAEAVAKACGYPVTEDIGYPTPGCLGTWAGAERQIPTITLELERGVAREQILAIGMSALTAALDYWENHEWL